MTSAPSSSSSAERRFVVLTHDHPFLHWDLLLEEDDACQTWRLLSEPNSLPVDAEPLPDHRKHYLDYEGPVSGARGSVARWDHGTYRVLASPGDHGKHAILLKGERLSGQFELQAGQPWRFRIIDAASD